MTTPKDELRRLALGAQAYQPGPYHIEWADEAAYYIYHSDEVELRDPSGNISDFLNAADPQTILALLDEVEALRVDVNVLNELLRAKTGMGQGEIDGEASDIKAAQSENKDGK